MARAIGLLQPGGRDIGLLQQSGAGGEQTIVPGSIGPGSSLGEPTLVAPQSITPAGIASTASLGAPTLIGSPQDIVPAGIASGVALGEPRLANTLTIRPGGIDSTAALGEPELTGGPRVIFPGSIGPGSKLGAPALIGGETGLQSFVAGANRTRWMRRGTMTIRSQTRGRWSGYVEYHNTPNGYPHHVDTDLEWIRPAVGMPVIFVEFGRNIFRGCISEVEVERLSGSNVLTYKCHLLDKSARCDSRLTRRVYLPTEDAADVVRDIVQLSLNGEGIVLDGAFPALLGAIGAPIQAFSTVTQAFDQIAAITGMPWFIDLNQTLYFVDPTLAEDAPFSISETSENWVEESLTLRETLTDYRNVQVVQSNRRIEPGDGEGTSGSRTETYTLLDAGGGIGYQEEARNRQGFPLPDGYIALQFPILQVTSVTVNDSPVDAYDISDPAWEAFINESGFLEQAFFYQRNTDFIAPVLSLSPGDVIVVTYVPSNNTAVNSATDPLTVTASTNPLPGEQGGTCGSGIYEHVEQVNDITTENEALAIASKLIEKFSVVPKIIQFSTTSAGLEVGHKINVNVPRNLIEDEDFFITSISGRSKDGTDLGALSTFEYRITAENISDRGNTLKFWERFYARTRHPSPFDSTIPTTIVLGPGSALQEGVSFTNPGRLNVSGILVKIVALFNDPPEDQDLIIDILINGASILDTAKIRIPAGDSSQLEFENFAAPVIQGYVGDRVDVTASYEVTGSDPVAARNGTVYLLWTA